VSDLSHKASGAPFGTMEFLRIGIHTSISGSLEKAALKAAELGANTFQIFSSSPRMWRPSVPAKDDIVAMRRARERLDLRPLVIHVNYLVNLASLDPVIRERSITSFRGELERAAAIGAEYLVTHPGNYRGLAVDQAIAAFVTLRDKSKQSPALRDELREFVAKKIGALARPDDILFSADLPKTRSGKIMRRLLRDIAEGRALGDTTTLADPNVVASLRDEYEDKEG